MSRWRLNFLVSSRPEGVSRPGTAARTFETDTTRIRPIQARPPRSRGAAACDAAASAASCSGLGLCGFLRDGVDSAGFCDLYYGLKEDYSGGDAAGERWRSDHAK